MVTTARITARSRNLRFAFSTVPTGNGIEIATPEMPARSMSVKAVEDAIDDAARTVSGGTYYNARLWVGDAVVVGFCGCGASSLSDMRFILNAARNGGAVVDVREPVDISS